MRRKDERIRELQDQVAVLSQKNAKPSSNNKKSDSISVWSDDSKSSNGSRSGDLGTAAMQLELESLREKSLDQMTQIQVCIS